MCFKAKMKLNGKANILSLIELSPLILLTTLIGCSYQYPRLNQTIRIAWDHIPRTTDPRYAADADSQNLGSFIHCSIFKYDKEGQLKNELAESVHWINPKTIEVILSPQFKFWDGTGVTATDVKATFDSFLNDTLEPSPFRSSFAHLKRVEALSPIRLRFYLDEIDGEFLYNLAIGILPKKIAENSKLQDPKAVIGCGKFKIDEWSVDHIQLKRRQENSQSVQYVRFEIVKDENTRLLKLRNSELDLVQNILNRDQLLDLKRFSQLKLQKREGLNTSYIGMKLTDPILKNVKVRQAISLAIQRGQIIQHLFYGWATAAESLLPPSDPYFNSKLKKFEYLPEKAKQLLDEAGFPQKGESPRFSLKFSVSTQPSSLLIARTLENDLKKIGIHLEIQSSDWGKFKEDVDKGNSQMWYLSWLGFKGHDIFRHAFATGSFPPTGANRGHFSNFELDRLVEKGKKEIHPIPRKILYHKIQAIVESELPYILLWHVEQFAVLNQRVHGYEISIDGRLDSAADVTLK